MLRRDCDAILELHCSVNAAVLEDASGLFSLEWQNTNTTLERNYSVAAKN